MATETAGISSPAQNNGDSKGQTAANVSAAQAVQRFVKKAEQPPESAAQTADTSAPEAPEAPAESSETSPAAEQANASSPEAEATPAEPTPPEAKAEEGKTKPDAEADDVLSPESQTLDAKTKEKIKRKIDREVVERKKLEAQVELLQKQITTLAQQQPQPKAEEPPADTTAPLPDIKDPATLVKHRQDVKTAMRNVEALLDSEEVETTGRTTYQGKEYTKAELKAYLREFRTTLDDLIPAQQEYFAQKAQIEQKRTAIQQVATQKFPFLAENNNPDVEAAHSFFQQNHPALVSSPDYRYILGAYIKGIKTVIEEETKAKAKPADEPKETPKAAVVPPKTPPKPPGDQTAVSTTGTAARLAPDAAARAALQRPTGSTSAAAVAAYLAKKEELSRTRA